MSSSVGIWGRIKSSFHKEAPKTRLTLDDVMRIATNYLAAEGDYRLREPYNVGLDEEKKDILWHICDSVNTRGGNYHMQISDATGEVVKTWATPR
jgi:hypothetical protein